MASSFTPLLRMELPVTGELYGTWGNRVNTAITNMIEQAVAGRTVVAMSDADKTLTALNGEVDESRGAVLRMTGALTAPRAVICPTVSKAYVFENATTGGFAVTLKTVAGTGIAVNPGGSVALRCDGTNVIRAFDASLPASLHDFGAVGDGVTNDAAAIQAAHDSLPAVGGTIMVGRGSFLHSTALTFTKRVRLIGEGVAITNAQSPSEFRKGAGIAGDGFILSGQGTTVEGVAFRGVAGNTGDGVVVKANRITFRDCGFYAMGNDGLRIGTDAGLENVNLWMIDNCKAKSNGRHGVHVSEGATTLPNSNAGTCLHLDAQANGADGLNFGYTALNTIVGGAYQQNVNYGLRLSANSRNNAIYGGDYELNTISQIRIDSGSIDNFISSYTLLFSAVSRGATTDPNTFLFGDRVEVPVGITFPATAVASTDANTLDDYQETNFSGTVDIAGAGVAGVTDWTGGTRLATCTRIGNRVFVSGALRWVGQTGSGGITITNLPYAAHASLGRTAFTVATDNLTYTAGSVVIGYLENSGTSVALFTQIGTGSYVAIPMDTAATLYLNFSYLAA